MRLCLSISVLLVSIACGPAPLANAQRSADDLARAVLDALARRDDAVLNGLALSEQEFRGHVWPSLPAARPERNLPFSYVWGDLRQKSDTFLKSTLANHGGRRYQFVSVRVAGPATEYAAFRVHRDAVFVVRDSSSASVELRLCGSLIEKDGVWKVFSYVIDS